jgi:DNA adenine methylase
MTSYHGGKQRIGLSIAEYIHMVCIILEYNQEITIPKFYCEPFCGMMGVYQHIPDLFNNKLKLLAGDTNDSVIQMWEKTLDGWKPPTTCTLERYLYLKDSPPSALKGYIGHQYSFGGQYFMGYAPKYGKSIDSSKASDSIVSISKKIHGITLSKGPYTQYSNIKNAIIYCDPPYSNTSQRYKNLESFNSEDFWEWCRYMGKYNIIFVSSYKAPPDFIEIMSSSHKLTGIIHSQADKKRTEKLYLFPLVKHINHYKNKY